MATNAMNTLVMRVGHATGALNHGVVPDHIYGMKCPTLNHHFDPLARALSLIQIESINAPD
jgi:hypothetical protein